MSQSAKNAATVSTIFNAMVAVPQIRKIVHISRKRRKRKMQIIKYRAKRKDTGEWIKGFYFCIHHDDHRKHLHHFIIPENIPLPKGRSIGEVQVEIIPETLCRYIGDDDKDGTEIYERDILSQEHSIAQGLTLYYVRPSSYPMIYWHPRPTNPTFTTQVPEKGKLKSFKVVGNELDNPDMGAKIAGKDRLSR
jgi:hypothetical protein